jgi:lysine 6-dehydrogenase
MKTYAILGAGMQGTAAAYDLARFAQPTRIILADVSLDQAISSSTRVNRLAETNSCEAVQVNALAEDSIRPILESADVVLSCLPYWMHPSVAPHAIACGCHWCDLGGNTQITWQTLNLDETAAEKGVSIVPDCGLAPGLVNSIGLWLIEHLDETDTVNLYCGVLPQHPQPPFNYKLTFNVEGLVTEYDYKAIVLRNGEIKEVDTLAELEELDIPELGRMEAFTTSGGTSTAPYSLRGIVRNYEYKTIRFPGHCERMRIFKDFGFWREDAIEVKGVRVAPKDVFNRVFGESLGKITDTDQCVVRGVGLGRRNGRPVRLQVDLLDRQCEQTGFTSMERLTGCSISIYAQHLANDDAPRGCVRYERAMTGTQFVEQLERRGISFRFTEEEDVNPIRREG